MTKLIPKNYPMHEAVQWTGEWNDDFWKLLTNDCRVLDIRIDPDNGDFLYWVKDHWSRDYGVVLHRVKIGEWIVRDSLDILHVMSTEEMKSKYIIIGEEYQKGFSIVSSILDECVENRKEMNYDLD